MDWPRAGGIAGLGAAVLWTVGWVLGGLIQGGGYDWASQEISDLGALTARHAWVWNLADSLGGALICLFAVGLLAVAGDSRAARWSGVLTLAVGIGSIADGLLREDCPLSTSAACQRLQDGPGLSWHHTAHDVESVIVAFASVWAPLILAAFFARRGERRMRLASLACGVAAAVAFLAYLPLYGEDGAGIAQRIAVLAYCVWLAVVSLWLLGERRYLTTSVPSIPA